MVNFLLLLFQKSLIFPFEEICAALKKPLDFFSLVFFFDFWSSLFVSHRLRAGNNNEH